MIVHDPAESVRQRQGAVQVQDIPAVDFFNKGDRRRAERIIPDHLIDMAEFCTNGPEKLAPCRGVAEQVAYLAGRAVPAAGFVDLGQLAVFELDDGAQLSLSRPGGNAQVGYRTDRRNCLAAKAEGGDAGEILSGPDL